QFRKTVFGSKNFLLSKELWSTTDFIVIAFQQLYPRELKSVGAARTSLRDPSASSGHRKDTNCDR
ncbi:MAG: hypothetical protein ACYT04_95960, partial [Nostoc sp.]